VYVCDSLARRLLPAVTGTTEQPNDGCGIVVDVATQTVLIPDSQDVLSITPNATAFLNYRTPAGVYPLRPPFFRSYDVVVVADESHACYSAAAAAAVAPAVAALVLVATVWRGLLAAAGVGGAAR
jgi:hypothetical protein